MTRPFALIRPKDRAGRPPIVIRNGDVVSRARLPTLERHAVVAELQRRGAQVVDQKDAAHFQRGPAWPARRAASARRGRRMGRLRIRPLQRGVLLSRHHTTL